MGHYDSCYSDDEVSKSTTRRLTMKCDVCGQEFEKILDITITNQADSELIRKAELVPMCLECFLRYSGVSFKRDGIPDRWLA